MSVPLPKATKQLDSATDFLLRAPLYAAYGFGEGTDKNLALTLFPEGKLDAHCVYCERESIFRRRVPNVAETRPPAFVLSGNRFHDVELECERDRTHSMYFRLLVLAAPRYSQSVPVGVTGSVQKIGQWPSVADLGGQRFAEYKGVLGARFADLNRGVGLAAHGVGAGSFVYLRRVFEYLIQRALTSARGKNSSFDVAAFEQGRMEDRILMLETELPEFLVEHRGLYGILSKGIHELTDDECLEHFEVVLEGIEHILEDELMARRRAERRQSAAKGIQAARGKLKATG